YAVVEVARLVVAVVDAEDAIAPLRQLRTGRSGEFIEGGMHGEDGNPGLGPWVNQKHKPRGDTENFAIVAAVSIALLPSRLLPPDSANASSRRRALSGWHHCPVGPTTRCVIGWLDLQFLSSRRFGSTAAVAGFVSSQPTE